MELPLRDIHLPAAIHWWPLALGWWLVIGVVLLGVALAVYFTYQALKPSLKKQASKKLDSIELSYRENEDGVHCVSELSVFLRRVVLSQEGALKENSTKYAGLTGKAWLRCLDKSLKQPEFSQGVGQILLKGPYQSQVEKEDVSQLIQLCRKWVNGI